MMLKLSAAEWKLIQDALADMERQYADSQKESEEYANDPNYEHREEALKSAEFLAGRRFAYRDLRARIIFAPRKE